MREAPDFELHIKKHRFKVIRSMVMYVKADLSSSQVDPWAMFPPMVVDFNKHRSETIQPEMT
jgi:hypothetical protein